MTKRIKNMRIPSFNEYINEGILTNYRTEKEGMKITFEKMNGSFTLFLKKLIEERIPFYFDCTYEKYTRIGYLMNETINNIHFNGYILDPKIDNPEKLYAELENVLKNTVIEKPGKLHIGRSMYSDLTKSNDLDTILVLLKAIKEYKKSKSLGKEITGNKFEVNVNIEFLCDRSRINDMIDFIF